MIFFFECNSHLILTLQQTANFSLAQVPQAEIESLSLSLSMHANLNRTPVNLLNFKRYGLQAAQPLQLLSNKRPLLPAQRQQRNNGSTAESRLRLAVGPLKPSFKSLSDDCQCSRQRSLTHGQFKFLVQTSTLTACRQSRWHSSPCLCHTRVKFKLLLPGVSR